VLLGRVLPAGMAGERAARAQIRARQAAHRVMQLRERIQRLRSGAPPTIAEVRSAGQPAAQAVVNAAQARQDAANAYRRAAQAHRAAAVALQTNGDLARAEWHRDQAANDDLAAEAELFRCPSSETVSGEIRS
jgi:hypothetical protein